MDKPVEGPIDVRSGPFIRNPQDLGDGFFFVEQQRGLLGKGKVWRPGIIRRNPKYVVGSKDYYTRNEWMLCAEVHPQMGKYVIDNYVKATVWWDTDDGRHGVEGYFPKEAFGVDFIIRIAKEFVK